MFVDSLNQTAQTATGIQYGLTMVKLSQANHLFVQTLLSRLKFAGRD
jgi:hypothetical protein